MNRWILLGVAGIAAIGAAAFLVGRRAPKPQPKIPVSIPAATEIVLVGRVVPRTIVNARSPIEGVLDSFFVDAGAEVIEGQLLGRVRNPKADVGLQQAQAELDRAQARLTELNGEQLSARLEVSRAEAEQSRAQGELDRLQKVYERQKGLWAAGATARLTFEKSEKDYNDAKAGAEKQARAAKEAASRAESISHDIDAVNRSIAEKNVAIERAKEHAVAGELHSPADGIVVARHGQPGDMVDPSAALVDIATDLTALQVIITPDAVSLAKIHANLPATVRLGDEEGAGAVQEVRGNEVVIYFNASKPITKLNESAQVKIKF